MNHLTLTDTELNLIKSALGMYYAQAMWSEQLGRANEINDVTRKLTDQTTPDVYWFWINFSDPDNIEIVTVHELQDSDFSPWAQKVSGPYSGYIGDKLIGPFSTLAGAEEVVHAFLHDDDPPQCWYWVYQTEQGDDVLTVEELLAEHPPSFSRVWFSENWHGPYTSYDEKTHRRV